MVLSRVDTPAGAKAQLSFLLFAARLKPCPGYKTEGFRDSQIRPTKQIKAFNCRFQAY